MYWVGIDVGGTFTDVVLYDSTSSRLSVLKTPSTPADQSEGIMRGVEKLAIDFRQIVRFGHGSTVATNTALERNGARTAVVVTKGHRDILIVGRGNRILLYNIKAPPIAGVSGVMVSLLAKAHVPPFGAIAPARSARA